MKYNFFNLVQQKALVTISGWNIWTQRIRRNTNFVWYKCFKNWNPERFTVAMVLRLNRDDIHRHPNFQLKSFILHVRLRTFCQDALIANLYSMDSTNYCSNQLTYISTVLFDLYVCHWIKNSSKISCTKFFQRSRKTDKIHFSRKCSKAKITKNFFRNLSVLSTSAHSPFESLILWIIIHPTNIPKSFVQIEFCPFIFLHKRFLLQ